MAAVTHLRKRPNLRKQDGTGKAAGLVAVASLLVGGAQLVGCSSSTSEPPAHVVTESDAAEAREALSLPEDAENPSDRPGDRPMTAQEAATQAASQSPAVITPPNASGEDRLGAQPGVSPAAGGRDAIARMQPAPPPQLPYTPDEIDVSLDPIEVSIAGERPAAGDETPAMASEAAAGEREGDADQPRPEPTLQPGMESRTFEAVGPGDAVRVSFDDLDLLKVLGVDRRIPLDVVESFPGWLADLDGRRVRLRGFMYPPFEATGIRGFLLARDNEICCFGRDPLPYDILPVRLAEGETTDYLQAVPFDVVGTFHIDTLPSDLDETELQQLYSIDEATIIR